jgi:hypothetical protein
MDLKQKLKELIMQLDPEIQALVTEVLEIENEYLDSRRSQAINRIKDAVDKYAKYGLGMGDKDEA